MPIDAHMKLKLLDLISKPVSPNTEIVSICINNKIVMHVAACFILYLGKFTRFLKQAIFAVLNHPVRDTQVTTKVLEISNIA